MTYEAKTYRAYANLDGILVTVTIRAFVEHGKVLAIRSAHVLDLDGNLYPTTDNGKATAAELAALLHPMV